MDTFEHITNATDSWQDLYPVRRKVDVSAKEVILVTLALMLLATSLCLFYKNWKKNYRDINQLPYYSYMYKDESPEPPVSGVPLVAAQNKPVMNWAKAAAAVALVTQAKKAAAGATSNGPNPSGTESGQPNHSLDGSIKGYRPLMANPNRLQRTSRRLDLHIHGGNSGYCSSHLLAGKGQSVSTEMVGERSASGAAAVEPRQNLSYAASCDAKLSSVDAKDDHDLIDTSVTIFMHHNFQHSPGSVDNSTIV